MKLVLPAHGDKLRNLRGDGAVESHGGGNLNRGVAVGSNANSGVVELDLRPINSRALDGALLLASGLGFHEVTRAAVRQGAGGNERDHLLAVLGRASASAVVGVVAADFFQSLLEAGNL